MIDYKLDLKHIKNFFYQKFENNKIKKTRIFGILMEYVKNDQYIDFATILEYVKPYSNYENIDILIDKYKKLAKHKRISAKQYKKDYPIVQSILDKINPSDIKPADGIMRSVQLKTLDFSKEIITDIKNNTDINLWLDGGTLLGAVRHKGFIPWDDDMDFAMLREDYDKLKKYLDSKYLTIDTNNWETYGYQTKILEILEKYPDTVINLKTRFAHKVLKGNKDSFIFLDFFVWDYFNDNHNVITLQDYSNNIKKQLKTKKKYHEFFELFKNEIAKNTDVVQKSDVVMPGIDNIGFLHIAKKEIVRYSDIFPLNKMPFEDWGFYVPNNAHVYLKSLYNFYNKIPISGLNILHHTHTKNMKTSK